MAQLSDDCFAFDGPLMPLDDALARLDAVLEPCASIADCPTGTAVGRFLAEDLVAALDVPPCANSAVDGYAVSFAGLNSNADTVLPVAGRVAAGHPLDRPARPGEAIRIFTGAPLPDGVDTVMMQEDCREDNGEVHIRPGIKRGANTRAAGEDVAVGTVLLTTGQRLTPPAIGIAAAQGLASLKTYEPLRVAVFSTGDEVAEPGSRAEPGQLFDSNRYMIGASLTAMGCRVDDKGIYRDSKTAIVEAIAAAAGEADVIVSTGGMSTGEEDHVRAAIETLGRVDFWRLAIKPGRPVGLGLIQANGRSVPVVGLPGNPVAAYTTFAVLARPIIRRLAGAADTGIARYRVVADFDYRKKKDRREFIRTIITGRDGETGMPIVAKHGRGGAGMLSSLVGATGFAELPEHVTELDRGAIVDYLPFNEVDQ